ncbi:Gp49 family protein [Priestia megaterium]|uniref:Gp49 family protein n=1 Tax=Priestia megaterium TaxID=1404 RepID=UPI000BED66FC|nr:Gp49 family protein [Priestia megaterium]PED63994.1 hypothetical protein CON20_23815 [Priestia megaterium]
MKQNTVTQDQIDSILRNSLIKVQTVLGKCTIVICELPNGFILVESSACVDKANYNQEIGREICLKRIENKIWELEGYTLQKSLAS